MTAALTGASFLAVALKAAVSLNPVFDLQSHNNEALTTCRFVVPARVALAGCSVMHVPVVWLLCSVLGCGYSQKCVENCFCKGESQEVVADA